MKRILCLIVIFASVVGYAARQEDNMNQMVRSLHHELTLRWSDIQKNRKADRRQLKKVEELVHEVSDDSKQCAIVVFSTDNDSFQDVAFASQNALSLFHKFDKRSAPYAQMLRSYEQTTQRQDSLMCVLESIDSTLLDSTARVKWAECIGTLKKIQYHNRHVLKHLHALQPEYIASYDRLKEASEASQKKFAIIRNYVFTNFNGNILDIIRDWDGFQKRQEKAYEERMTLDDALSPDNNAYLNILNLDLETDDVSNWGAGRIIGILMAMGAAAIIAFLLAWLVRLVRWIVKLVLGCRVWRWLHLSRLTDVLHRGVSCISGRRTLILSFIWLNVLIWCIPFYQMEPGEELGVLGNMLYEIIYFFAMQAVILTFLSLRYVGRQFWRALAICLPTQLIFVYALLSVVVVMPDDEILIDVPFITTVLFLVQLGMHKLWKKKLDTLMSRVSRFSVISFAVAMVVALLGLQFLAMMVSVFWFNFMVAMILLWSLKQFLDRMIQKYGLDQKSVRYAWWIPVINRVLYPMAWVYVVLWAARIACMFYSLDEVLNHFLNTYFRTPIGNISINVSLLLFICWNILLAAYISKTLYKFVEDYHHSRNQENWHETSLLNQNVINILVWGIAIINIMIRLGVSTQWIGYSMAGLSTGIGFASREILEDLIYGLTLRNGQLHVGDWITCEGLRGQIKSIGILSTRMDDVEGSTVCFANSRLFRMEYQNITLNHGYELLHTTFRVDYNTDVDQLRQLLIDGYKDYEWWDHSKDITLHCKKFHDSWFEMDFRVWVPADQYIQLRGFNVEYVYKTLKAHGIEIPYPTVNLSEVRG